MKNELWKFLIKLAIFTVVFGLIWFLWAQDAYPRLLKPIVFPFFQWIGVKKWRLSLLLDHFTNIIPYLALVCATPGFFTHWKKTIIALLGGFIILMVGHIVLSWLDYHYWSQYDMTKKFFRSIFHFYLLNDALPLGLWLLFYPRVLPQLFSFLRFGKGGQTAETGVTKAPLD